MNILLDNSSVTVTRLKTGKNTCYQITSHEGIDPLTGRNERFIRLTEEEMRAVIASVVIGLDEA